MNFNNNLEVLINAKKHYIHSKFFNQMEQPPPLEPNLNKLRHLKFSVSSSLFSTFQDSSTLLNSAPLHAVVVHPETHQLIDMD